MFEKAANDTPVVTTPEVTTPPVVKEEVDVTKIVAKRISEEREKIRKETLDEQAQSLGFANHDELVESMRKDKLEKHGLDPKEIAPLITDLIKTDPQYQEALKYKKEKEALEKELWAKQEIDSLNRKYGTTFAKVEDLAPEVIKLWNNGLPLDKAYAAENIDQIAQTIVKTKQANGKGHLVPPPDTGNSGKQRVITDAEIKRMKSINPDKTEAQIREYLSKKQEV